MATEPDPYRTLGLPRTASLTEVKAAYRRLAKANHPDTAGEAAIPRFLAIQAAYERLAGPTPGRRAAAAPTPPPPKRQPWEADPDRSDATHRAYGGRARRPAGSTSRKTGSRPKTGASGGGTSGARPAGGTGTTDGAGSTKDPKKATLGSTSYDEADREAFEPDWAGSSWYGTTSGTYWTINPKEYADPRKHGPEYQARARRSSQAGKDADAGIGARPAASAGPAGPSEPPTTGDPAGPDATSASGAASASAAGPTARPTADPAPRHTTSSWWDATSGAADHGRDAGDHPPPNAAPRPRPSAPPRPSETDPARDGLGLSAIWRALTDGAPPSLGWRLARAVIGGLPIALAIGWTVGEMSGCARYAATCDDGIGTVALVVQLLVFLTLLAVPVVAGWAVVAAAVSLVVAVPATLFITANAGGQASTVGGSFLGVVLALAWVLGIVGAILMGRRRSFDPTGPVS